MAIATNPVPTGERMTTKEFVARYGDEPTAENQGLELLDGRVWRMMAEGQAHADAVYDIAKALERSWGPPFRVHTSGSIAIGADELPEPDVFVREPGKRRAQFIRVSEVRLIVEVAQSTYAYDSTEKLARYAQAGVPTYWIAQLRDFGGSRDRSVLHRYEIPHGGSYQQYASGPLKDLF